MNIHIFYHRLFDPKGIHLTIGGVQKYIIELAKALSEDGHKVTVVQMASTEFTQPLHNFTVRGYNINGDGSPNAGKKLFYKHKGNISQSDDLIVWASETIAYKLRYYKTLSIQHGIFLDYYSENRYIKTLFKRTLWFYVYKIKNALVALRNFNKSKYKVCVDYNFLNWYRTLATRVFEERIKVIPNFAPIYKGICQNFKERNDDDRVKILFARRFEEYRGAKLMADVVEDLLSNYSNLEITFAGEGPCHGYIESKFANNSNVSITKYGFDDSLSFHANFNIAVVPTIAMEGTSLSLLEAMSAGCAVVASNIGGLTNIVINGYNGLLIMPFYDDLKNAIVALINNEEKRKILALNGRDTIAAGFNLDDWKKSWKEFIRKIDQE